MNIFVLIVESVKRIQRKIKASQYYKDMGAVVDKSASIDFKTVLEGHNYIAGELNECYIGFGSYIHKGSVISHVKMGRFCCVGEDVNIRLFEHPTEMVSMSPCFYRKKFRVPTYVREDIFEDLSFLESGFTVEIGNDVWIGRGVSIMCKVKIGDGAVIGAGAVVTHDVEPYSIVGGVPAKLIKYRFDSDTISRLLKIQWWNNDEEWLLEHGHEFSDVNSFINKY